MGLMASSSRNTLSSKKDLRFPSRCREESRLAAPGRPAQPSPATPQDSNMAAKAARAGHSNHHPPASPWLAAIGRRADEALRDWCSGFGAQRSPEAARGGGAVVLLTSSWGKSCRRRSRYVPAPASLPAALRHLQQQWCSGCRLGGKSTVLVE